MEQPEKTPGTDLQFVEIATQLQNGNYEATYTKLVAAYVSKIAAMKMTTEPTQVEHAITMGHWFLIETAQHMFGLTYDEAIAVARVNINAARKALKHAA